MSVLGIVIALFGLSIVVFVHELGHMLVAKRAGIGVLEFSVGMGPKLFSRRRKETIYSIRLLPFGGFVRLAGMDDEDGDEVPPEKNYYAKPLRSRLATIAAGSVFNIVFGFLLFSVLYMFMGVPTLNNRIDMVKPDSPAMKAGLLAGDAIIEVNGHAVTHPQDDIITQIHRSGGQPLVLTFQRAGQTISTNLIPQIKGGKGIIGVQLGVSYHRYSPIKAVYYGGLATIDKIKLVFVSIKMLLAHEAGLKDLAGPVGIIQLTSFELQRGLVNFIGIMALISISLGVANLFPFPVLDGGHILFLAIEAVRGKRLSKKTETFIYNVSAAILIGLMVIIVVNDVLNWQGRVNLLNQLSK